MLSRRALAFAAILAMLPTAISAQAATFLDVQATPYATVYAYLSKEGIVSGYADGSGRPYASINRAELLKVILSMRSEDRSLVKRLRIAMPPLPLFSDVDQKSWYAPYVEAAFERKIITGYPDGTFRPANPVTVEEAVTMLLRAYGEKAQGASATLSPSIENRDNQWFTPYVNASIEKNIVMHAARLRLGTPITRGAFFAMAYRMHDLTAKRQTAFSGPETSPPPAIVASRPQIAVAAVQTLQYASQKYFAISMPSIGISDLAVIHPSDPFTSQGVLEPLQNGVGHLFSFPGGGGKVLIYGHSSGYPWDKSQYTKIFRRINELKTGEKVYVTYDGKLHMYEVTHGESVPAGDTSRYNDDGKGEELILYTCWPPDSISERYLVHAVPVQKIALR
ncbi:sortase [Candidatus Peribacteria bacterium]|nr:sortase [Candidatus Peribacteria bacterium]